MEPETDQAWTSGKYAFMRNWTYAYAADQTGGSKVKGKYAVAPLPSVRGRRQGRHPRRPQQRDLASTRRTRGSSLKFSDFVASPEWQKISLQQVLATRRSSTRRTTTRTSRRRSRTRPSSRQALGQAKARPVSPVYPQISQAIYKNVNDALAGRTSPADAIKKASDQINSALSTF